MKRFIKEIVVVVLQIFVFYLVPLLSVFSNGLDMVLSLVLDTFTLSMIMGSFSREKIKYLYPIVCAILFIPSIFIYYDVSALIHSFWYLIVSFLGLVIGIVGARLVRGK